MEFTLLGAAIAGVVGFAAFIRWEARRGNAVECSRSLFDVGMTAALVGVAVGRVAAMLGDGVNPIANPGDVLIVRAGVATGWASLGALAAVAMTMRREWWIAADGLAAATLGGLAGWHGGCLVREACLGEPSSLPWARSQPGSSITRHPVELYAAAFFLIGAFVVAWWKARGRPWSGAPAGVALVVAGAVRLGTEPLRPSLGGGPVAWYVAAVVVGTLVVAARHPRITRRVRTARNAG